MIRNALKYFGMLLLATSGLMVAQGWQTFGKKSAGERLQRIMQSPEWNGLGFENPQPLVNYKLKAVSAMMYASDYVAPHEPVPVVMPKPEELNTESKSGLSVIWLGHAGTLVEIEGFRVLTDPMFSERASPFSWVGPKRWYPPPITPALLPKIDVVVISHDHYDHLDMYTVQMLASRGVTFVVPLGIGANLEYWGINSQQIFELDWWQETSIQHEAKTLRIVMTPARHASGRYGLDNSKKLWAGYAMIGATHRVYFSGDTGLFPAMKEIGRRLGPFDLTMIEVGQYNQAWPDWHIGPEQAVQAHEWVRGRVMLPIHWGLFVLAPHSWTEPVERATAEAQRRSVAIVTPKPGQRFEPKWMTTNDVRRYQVTERWWPKVPGQTATEAPIVSTQVGEHTVESF
jgi:L-ascorbate metabolism protein UlaG (beta-lactamase superfamily)